MGRDGTDPEFGWSAVWDALSSLPDRRHEALAVLNGAYGDALEREGSPLAIATTFFTSEGPLDLDQDLAEQIPEASANVVVLVHGLMATETVWAYPNGRSPGYGERLARDLDITPIYVRYNTGRSIATSGRDLAFSLERLFRAWPVELEQVDLIGHSMGALVCRSAAYHADRAELEWVGKLRRMFLLAVPRKGQPLEQFTGVAAVTPTDVPTLWRRIVAWCLRQQSAGVLDLLHGSYGEPEGSGEGGVDEPAAHELPLLPNVEHYVVAASMAQNVQHPLGRIFAEALNAPWAPKDGRLAAWVQSLAGRRARVFTGMSHLSLVNHPEVYRQLLDWMREDAEGDPSTDERPSTFPGTRG